MIAVFACIYIIAAIIALIKPKIGVHAVWTLVWLYPVGRLHALLPLHVRFDDLFLVWISLVVFLRCSDPNDKSSVIVRLAFLWFVAIVLGNLVGLMTGAGYMWQLIVRYTGKRLYVPLIAYVVWKTVRNEKEIKTHVMSILLAGIGATIIAILQVYAPRLVFAWEQAGYLYGFGYLREQLGEEARRAGGSLGTIYYAATAMALALLAIRFLVRRCGWKLTFTSLFGAPIFTVGLILSGTRSSIGGFMLGVIYMMVRQKRRFLIAILSGVFLLYIVFETTLVERLQERISGKMGHVAGAYEVRKEIWRSYLVNFSPHYFFFGRGFLAEEARFGGASVHSSYIGAFAYTGTFGTVVTAAFLFVYWRYARRLRKLRGYVFANVLGEAMHSIIIATLFVGIVNELLQGHPMRLIAVLGVLAERYIYLSNQDMIETEQGDLFFENDEIDPSLWALSK